MSIHKNERKYFTIVCDACGEDSSEEYRTFTIAFKDKKRLNYITLKNHDGEFKDYCPICQNLM